MMTGRTDNIPRLMDAASAAAVAVAAISYYIIGLLGYLFKGLKEIGIGPDPSLATAAAVPIVVLAVALIVRRIRGSHGET